MTALFFIILAIELLLRRHDVPSPDSGVPLADTLIRLLCYADDVVVAKVGDEDGVSRVEGRVNDISDESAEDTDMEVKLLY